MKEKTKYKILKTEIATLIIIAFLNVDINLKTYNDIKKETIEFENNNDDIIKLYNEYIKILANYYKNNYDNVFNISESFHLMYINNLLSYGDGFFENGKPDLDITKYGGIDVVNGKGVCRNVNCCFTDILKSIGFDCGNVYGTTNYKNNVEIIPNHVLTWVNIDEYIYLLDPYNNFIFKKNKLFYSSSEGATFVPSLLTTKKMNEKINLKVFFYEKNDSEIYVERISIEQLINAKKFEEQNLEELEKQIVLKLNTLQ